MPNDNTKRAKTLGAKAVQNQAKKASKVSPWRKQAACSSTRAKEYAARISTAPDKAATLGQWNAWAAAGKTQQERAERLEIVPERYRTDCLRHLQTVQAIKTFYARKGKA